MSKFKQCACGDTMWFPDKTTVIDDCNSCGAAGWRGGESPRPDSDGKTCDSCGTRVLLWMDQQGATVLGRCAACGSLTVRTSS